MRGLALGAIVVLSCALVAQGAAYWTEDFEAGQANWTTVNSPGAVDATPAFAKGSSWHSRDTFIDRIARSIDASADDSFVLQFLFYTNTAQVSTGRYFGAFMGGTPAAPAAGSGTLARLGGNNAGNYQFHWLSGTVQLVDTGVPLSVTGWHIAQIKFTISTQTVEWKLDGATGSIVNPALARPTVVVLGYNFPNGSGSDAYDSSAWFDNIWVGPAADAPTYNVPVVVNAGADQNTDTTGSKNISGSVTDDGVATVTHSWSQVSGPAATFGDASQLATTVNCPTPGIYVLRLTATDGELTRWDDVRILVNTAPTVDAGLDANVVLPASANLDATVTDDGLPTPVALTTTWTKDSGPGTVTFGDPAAVDTTADFSLPGVYVLRLTANDGSLSADDTVTITVTGTGQNPVLQTAVSRKNHGAAGDFDISILPSAVECRVKPAGTGVGATKIICTFDIPIQLTLGLASVTLTSGTVTALTPSGTELVIDLTNGAGNATQTVAFPGVADANSAAHVTASTFCFVNVVGDVNGTDRTANVFDLVAVRNVLNTATIPATFRRDVNADGTINVFDLVTIRNNLNQSSPACP